MSTHSIRIWMSISAILLFAAELYIGIFQHHNWIRYYLGDVLVIILLYCIFRAVSPCKPQWGLRLPIVLLLFSFAVEGLQAMHLADILHIENHLLRILIGTSFAWEDILSYFIGFLPTLLCEQILRKHTI